jgi:hypothetical protein
MRSSSEITNCVVVKLDHNSAEHLVAYVETKVHLDVNKLRDECSKDLPLYMMPALFVLINNFPLNLNGKLDRTALPMPDFSLILSSDPTLRDEEPRTEMERRVWSIWCQVLNLQSIRSTSISFFKLGGNSLFLMKLHRTYQTQLQQSINISDLFRRSTIVDHAQLLEVQQVTVEPQWHSYNITRGKSSSYKMSCLVIII